MMTWPVVKEVLLEDIFIFSSGGHFVQQSRMVGAIVVENIIMNIEIILNLDQWFRQICL